MARHGRVNIKLHKRVHCSCVDTWGSFHHGSVSASGGKDCYCKIGGKVRNDVVVGGKLIRIQDLEVVGPKLKVQR